MRSPTLSLHATQAGIILGTGLGGLANEIVVDIDGHELKLSNLDKILYLQPERAS